jgi:8-oxo-dGTP diphosphatase
MKLVQKAILKKDSKFLIILRSPNAKFFPGYWDFPGGKIEVNEDPIKGIEREVIEETNLIVKVLETT